MANAQEAKQILARNELTTEKNVQEKIFNKTGINDPSNELMALGKQVEGMYQLMIARNEVDFKRADDSIKEQEQELRKQENYLKETPSSRSKERKRIQKIIEKRKAELANLRDREKIIQEISKDKRIQNIMSNNAYDKFIEERSKLKRKLINLIEKTKKTNAYA